MHNAIDCTAKDRQPERNNNPFAAVYFVTYIILVRARACVCASVCVCERACVEELSYLSLTFQLKSRAL